MHICIQPAPIRVRSYQTEVHHLQDLRRLQEYCSRGDIYRERLGHVSPEAMACSRQRWEPGSTVCCLRHGIWGWERRAAVRQYSEDLIDFFADGRLWMCRTNTIFVYWTPCCAPIQVVYLSTRVSIGVAKMCWLYWRCACYIIAVGKIWPKSLISRHQLMRTAWKTLNGRLSWRRSLRSWV